MGRAYSIFLMIELAKCHDVIPKDLEYDSQWAKGQELYAAFEGSQYDDSEIGEYEAIESFLEAEPKIDDKAEALKIYNELTEDTKVLECLHDLLAVRYG